MTFLLEFFHFDKSDSNYWDIIIFSLKFLVIARFHNFGLTFLDKGVNFLVIPFYIKVSKFQKNLLCLHKFVLNQYSMNLIFQIHTSVPNTRENQAFLISYLYFYPGLCKFVIIHDLSFLFLMLNFTQK